MPFLAGAQPQMSKGRGSGKFENLVTNVSKTTQANLDKNYPFQDEFCTLIKDAFRYQNFE